MQSIFFIVFSPCKLIAYDCLNVELGCEGTQSLQILKIKQIYLNIRLLNYKYMNINNYILSEIEKRLPLFNISKEDILVSLSLKNNLKEQKSKYEQVIRQIMTQNDKEELYPLLIQLLNVEHHTRGLENWYRDHVAHSLQTFSLGIYVNDKLLNNNVNEFQWKLACLFHDIGYPLQISSDMNRSFLDNMIKIKKKIGGVEEVNKIKISIKIEGLEKLYNNKNASFICRI